MPALFLTPDLRRAGAETQAVDLVNGIDPGRFAKTLFTFGNNRDQADRIETQHVRHIFFPRAFRLDPRPVFQMARRIRRDRTAVLHCTLQISTFFGWAARELSGRRPPLVASIHTTKNLSPREEAFDRRLYRRVLGACARVIFVCRGQRDHWVRKFPSLARNAEVVYNGVDPDWYDPAPFVEKGAELRKSLGIPADAPALACVAGFRPEKGHRFLVSAFAGLSGAPYLLLAGEGENRRAVAEQVAAEGLGDRVRFLGAVADVRPVLAAADLTVLASTSVETFSMAMLESMSMETPVIGTRLGGFAEAVKDGETGAVVPPGDVAALRRALRIYLIDKDFESRRRMGQICRRRVRNRFSRERMIQETEKILVAAAAEGARF
jgi:glycosyltransferase involved in cell wall biosynthesis